MGYLWSSFVYTKNTWVAPSVANEKLPGMAVNAAYVTISFVLATLVQVPSSLWSTLYYLISIIIISSKRFMVFYLVRRIFWICIKILPRLVLDELIFDQLVSSNGWLLLGSLLIVSLGQLLLSWQFLWSDPQLAGPF